MELPFVFLSRYDYDLLPREEDQPENFIRYVPIGFQFRVSGSSEENAVIAKVVSVEDAFADQIGADLFESPERFANCYSVIFPG